MSEDLSNDPGQLVHLSEHFELFH